MGLFFIDTSSGQVATQQQLREAGELDVNGLPPRPWYRIQATGDATTMWYAVMRKQERGIFIGQLCFRHSPRHASLLEAGWEDVPISDIAVPPATQ